MTAEQVLIDMRIHLQAYVVGVGKRDVLKITSAERHHSKNEEVTYENESVKQTSTENEDNNESVKQTSDKN